MGYCLLFFIVSILIKSASGDCHTLFGPSGSTECVLLTPYYNKYQWATCLTDTYIKTFSKGEHLCRRPFVTYCWYQCMLEVNGLDDGPVYDNCACGSDAPRNMTTQPTVMTSAIPSWCFSPSGSDCSWYKDCLEKRYPCKEQGNSYALDYAEKFCNLYIEHYQDFDFVGKQWINAVRKCLQVKLVPILRPFVQATCDTIKQTAFGSHSGCYLNPDTNKPSICEIGVGNWWRVFWTVKGALIQDATATLKQMIDVMNECGSNILSTGVGKIQMVFRSVKGSILTNLNNFAERVADQIGRMMDWTSKGITYFGFPTLIQINRNKRAIDTKTDIVYINLLLAPKSEYDLNANDTPDVNVSNEAISVAKAIENGDVRLDIGEEAEFTELSLCIDFNCTETSLQVEPAPPEKKDDSGLNTTTVIIIVCAVTFGIVLIVSGVVIFRKKC